MQKNHSRRRKPLIIEGARQVGKTWLVKKFASQKEEWLTNILLYCIQMI